MQRFTSMGDTRGKRVGSRALVQSKRGATLIVLRVLIPVQNSSGIGRFHPIKKEEVLKYDDPLQGIAENIVRSMPRWNPGMLRGQPVNTQVVILIAFD